jgi:hypothetical protein
MVILWLSATASAACKASWVFNKCVPAIVAKKLLVRSNTFSLPVFLLGRRVRLVIVNFMLLEFLTPFMLTMMLVVVIIEKGRAGTGAAASGVRLIL